MVSVETTNRPGAGPGSTDYASEWSVARGTGRTVRIEVTLTVRNGGDESIIQARTVGPDFYFRTIMDDRESRWMKLPAAEVSGGLLGDFGNFDIDIFLGPAAGRLAEWTLPGETTCRTGPCAILGRPGGQVRKILVDKSTYDVVAIVCPREGADGQPTEAVIQVFDWGKDPAIEASSGDIIEASATELGEAFRAMINTIGLTE